MSAVELQNPEQSSRVDRDGKMSSAGSTESNHLRLKELFDKDGYLCQRNCLPDALSEWKEYCELVEKEVFQRLHANGHTAFLAPSRINSETFQREYPMELGVKHGFKEIVMRSPGRYEVSLRQYSNSLGQEMPSLDAILNGSLAFVPSLLGATSWEDVQICHTSLVISYPGSPDQSWHADGGHVNVDEHLPCHCLNVFIPLMDITMEMGPTELRPGTHYHTRNLVPMMLAARARKKLRAPVAPLLDLGDALLFDYRILHRGKANLSEKDRAILVLTVAKPWFKDVLNFPSRSLQDAA